MLDFQLIRPKARWGCSVCTIFTRWGYIVYIGCAPGRVTCHISDVTVVLSFQVTLCVLSLWSLNLLLSFSSNTSRDSRLVVDKVGDKWKNIMLFLKQFHDNFCSKTTRFQEIKLCDDVRWCFNASWGLKGLNHFQLTLCAKLSFSNNLQDLIEIGI